MSVHPNGLLHKQSLLIIIKKPQTQLEKNTPISLFYATQMWLDTWYRHRWLQPIIPGEILQPVLSRINAYWCSAQDAASVKEH